jgi:hypothetical protein
VILIVQRERGGGETVSGHSFYQSPAFAVVLERAILLEP